MSEIYAKEFSHPEIILSSTSKRTRLSLKPFAKALNIKKENIFFESSLYHASTDDIESVIFQQDPEVKSLMMFGHNPGYTEMANDYSSAYIENVPTTGIFTLEGESKDWKEFLKNCKLTRFIYPKMYV
jgi:phosphohistidine phosphatase